MRLRIEIDGHDHSAILKSIAIQKELAGRTSSASFDLTVAGNFPRYDLSTYDNSLYSLKDLPQQQSEVVIYNDDTDDKVFRGFITSIARQQRSRTIQIWQITCSGLEYLLENISINRSWTGKTDREIIQDAFGDVLPEIATTSATVAELAVAINFEAKDLTLRELLERLSQVSGAEWRITEEKELSWRAEGSVAAPFGFSDEPDNSTTYPWRIQSRQRNSNQFANKVTVLGAFAGTNGAELRSTAENTANQAELGRVIEAIVVNREIDNQPALNLAAEIELERRAVQETVAFEFDQDALEVGMLVPISSVGAGIDDSYVIQSLSLRQSKPDLTVYTAQVGDYRGGLADRLRQLDRIKTGPKLQPPVPPPPNSVTDAALKDGAVTRLKIAAAAVDTARLEVAAVTDSILAAGAVTETKVASNAISTPKIQAGAITSTTLASGAVIAGKIAAGVITGVEIQAGSITAADAVFANSAIVTANIANAAITNAKIDTVSASKLTAGTIDASVITVSNLNASNITAGTLDVARISTGSITGSKLADGTISAVKIASIDASTITAGTLDVARISAGSITGTKLANGTVTATQIANATITATQIANATITDAQIANATITSAKISSIAASKITAGTITASLSINSGGNLQVADFAIFNGLVQINNSTSINAALEVHSININSSGSLTMNTVTVIDGSSRAFVGGGVAVQGNGVGCGGVNIWNGGGYSTGQTATVVGSFTIGGVAKTQLVFTGGVLTNYS